MPGTRIVLKAGEPDPDPAPYLYLSAEHKRKNAEKPYDPKRSCWVPDPDKKFLEGLIQETNGGKVKVQLIKDKSVWFLFQLQLLQYWLVISMHLYKFQPRVPFIFCIYQFIKIPHFFLVGTIKSRKSVFLN